MISRRFLRTKTMQALYAYNMRPEQTMEAASRELIQTINNCYALFLWLFSILPEMTFYRTRKLEDLKGKNNPTEEDLNPNTKFVDNQVIAQIETNGTLQLLFQKYRINWTNDDDFIVNLFHVIEETDHYKTYMASPTRSYDEDKQFVLNIIKDVFAESELMHWFFGEKDPNWLDDYEEALAMVYKNIEDFKLNKGDHCKILTLFKNTQEDEQFCRDLFIKTIQNDAEYEKIIEGKLQNWEMERVIGMDVLLMKMAICEFLEFPTIPVKVTMNEYIDLAKLYSSDKSKLFINGILDRLIVDFRDQDRLYKTGRGLFQN